MLLPFAQDLAVAREGLRREAPRPDDARHCRNDQCGASLAHMRSDAVWCSRACAMDQKRRDRANRVRTRRGRGARSGAQLSYRKTREALMARLRHFPGGERLVDEALQAALPQRQRERAPPAQPTSNGWANAAQQDRR